MYAGRPVITIMPPGVIQNEWYECACGVISQHDSTIKLLSCPLLQLCIVLIWREMSWKGLNCLPKQVIILYVSNRHHLDMTSNVFKGALHQKYTKSFLSTTWLAHQLPIRKKCPRWRINIIIVNFSTWNIWHPPPPSPPSGYKNQARN